MEIEEYEVMYRVEDTHWWYVGLRNLLAHFWTKYVSIERPRVVDVGCGTGSTLVALGDAVAPIGLDFMPEALRFCRRRDLDRLIAASATDLPLAGELFDVALSFDVLCNKSIQDKRAPLREVYRVLRAGGLAFLNVPAYQWLHSSHDVHVHTDKRFTKNETVRLVRECGLEPLHATYWNTLLFPPILITRLWRKLFPPDGSDLATMPGVTANRVFGRALSVELALLRRAPLPFGLSVFVVARKPE